MSFVPSEERQRLVFTDLDGTLLDHNSYSYTPAMPVLRVLERRGVPVIPVTSKTRAEVEQLRRELGHRHPFIVENGAAICIPQGYFATQPEGTMCRGDYWLREFAPSRSVWLERLAWIEPQYRGDFTSFFRLGVAGIQATTGLSESRARQAGDREYSEPVQWLGAAADKQRFIAELERAGATVLQGGRFLSVSGPTDKGRALSWLRQCYLEQPAVTEVIDLAAGDSGNDVAMLEVADTALLVRSPSHEFPVLKRSTGVIRSTLEGPGGWAEGVTCWLAQDRDRE